MKIFTTIFVISILCFTVPEQAHTQDIFSSILKPVKESDTSDLSIGEIGTIDESQGGGFNYQMWQQGDNAYIISLLSRLPAHPRYNTAKELQRRLLLTRAAPPRGSQEGTDLLTLRLKYLALMHQLEDFAALYELIPLNRSNEPLKRLRSITLFMQNKLDQACTLSKATLPNYNNPFWLQNVIFCQHYEGNASAAELQISLAQEDGITLDKDFLNLLPKLAGNKKKQEKAKSQWADLLYQKIEDITLPLLEPKLDNISYNALKSIGLKSKSKEWFKSNKDKKNRKFRILERAFALNFTLSETIPADDWHQFLLYSIDNNLAENDAVYAYQRHLNQYNQTGKALTLALILLGDQADVKAPSEDTILQAIEILNILNLNQEAKSLALEAF